MVGRLLSEEDGDVSQDRLANRAVYLEKTKAVREGQLWEARADLVRRYRASRGSFPDGIDSHYDRWYREGEWSDAGIRTLPDAPLAAATEFVEFSLMNSGGSFPEPDAAQASPGKRDRSGYMRDHMRKKRAEAKKENGK